MNKLLLEAVCPHCKKDLTKDEWITLHFRLEDGRGGRLSLSAYFCTYTSKVPFHIKNGTIATMYCLHCKTDLAKNEKCILCNAPLFSIGIKTGGAIDVCSRKGCRGHAMGGFGNSEELMVLINNLVDSPFL